MIYPRRLNLLPHWRFVLAAVMGALVAAFVLTDSIRLVGLLAVATLFSLLFLWGRGLFVIKRKSAQGS